jgi:hypothetical protein
MRKEYGDRAAYFQLDRFPDPIAAFFTTTVLRRSFISDLNQTA